jgi:V8-like Glu-specific endopeptidase
MKSLLRAFSLTFLSLTLTNCSLSPEQITSRLEPSIVKIFYQNEPEYGTGFFVSGEKGLCTVLTAAHVVKKEGKNLLQTNDGKVWDVAKVEMFPDGIDLALVSFKPEKRKCNYSPLKIGNSDSLSIGASIYIFGFPIRSRPLVSQFVLGNVSGLEQLPQGYGVSYQALTVGGMSGAPVVDVKGEVVAVHGMSGVEALKTFASLASLQASSSESGRSVDQDAQKRVEADVQPYIFSWGIPIRVLQDYRDRAIALETEGQEVELGKELELEPNKGQETQERGQKKNQVSLVSAKGVDYRKLHDLLKAKKWKEADEETDRVILKVVRRELEGWLRYEDAQNFSCQDLGMIDKLWVKYSNGEFGISVQEQIYHNLGGTKEYDLEVWKKFGDKVGWRQKGEWLNYTELTSLEEHYSGHLPVAPFWGGVGVWFFSRASTCRY